MFKGVSTSSESMCHQFQQSHYWKAHAAKSEKFFLENTLLLGTYMESGHAYPPKDITGLLIHLSHIKGGFIK